MSRFWVCCEVVLSLWGLAIKTGYSDAKLDFRSGNPWSENWVREVLRKFCEINGPENVY